MESQLEFRAVHLLMVVLAGMTLEGEIPGGNGTYVKSVITHCLSLALEGMVSAQPLRLNLQYQGVST